MATTLAPALLDAFIRISNELSPENLMCDGERSAAAARRVAKALKARWAALEREAGRKVSEDEVWNAFVSRYRVPVGTVTSY